MHRKLLAATLFAAALGYLLWPLARPAQKVVALDDVPLEAALAAAGVGETRLGAAAVSLAARYGRFDPERGALVLSLGAASVALPVEDESHRFVTAGEGERREEMAQSLRKQLGWTEDEEATFAGATGTCSYRGGEGYRFPGRYLISVDATPTEIVAAMEERFAERYADLTATSTPAVDPGTVVKIASLIQREAAGKRDMRLISGVIWNRMMLGMPLQIDATLQYAKGREGKWWPIVASKDKRIESPYNTYQNDGLPPEPIASPGIAALEAAMHPADTSCLYYLHDRSRTIHCSSDYEGHLRNIRQYL